MKEKKVIVMKQDDYVYFGFKSIMMTFESAFFVVRRMVSMKSESKRFELLDEEEEDDEEDVKEDAADDDDDDPGFTWCAERRRAALFTLLRQQNVGILEKFLHEAASRRLSSVDTDGNTRTPGYVSQSLYLMFMSEMRHDESGIPSLLNSLRGLYSLHPFSEKNCCSYENAKTYETTPGNMYDLMIVSTISQLPSSGMNISLILRKSFVVMVSTLLPCFPVHDASSTDV